MTPYFAVSVVILAILLFFPVSRLIWVLSVRRLERKTGAPLSEPERQGQLSRARFIAMLIVVLFSVLYNLHLFRELAHG